MTTMIALVGEQPLPNFLPARHYHPDNILLVYTKTIPRVYDIYRYLQEKLQMEGVRVYGLQTDPYDILKIAEKLNDKLNWIKTQTPMPTPFEFNLTGGTKPMSLAAYQVAAQLKATIMYLQSENGQSVVDHYSWQDHQLVLQKEADKITKHINLRDMLELHLGPRQDTTGTERWVEKVPTTDNVTYGHAFEQAIAQVLGDNGYEVTYAVKDKRKQIDIDVMIRYQNQIGIIEAKTVKDGKNADMKGFLQLNTNMRYLRGTYVKPFSVIAGSLGDSLKNLYDDFKIPAIQLLQYKRDANAISLSYEDRETLLAEVSKIMKTD